MKKILLILLCLLCVGCFNGYKEEDTNEIIERERRLFYSDIFSKQDFDYHYENRIINNRPVTNNKNIDIDNEGTYLISGTAKEVTINVNADTSDTVRLILKDLKITNKQKACINIQNADKVYIILEGKNKLYVTDSFVDKKTDATIFSKDDLVILGTGSLDIESSFNGIVSNDDIRITGGAINITSGKDAIKANNLVAITKTTMSINAKNDGLYSDYSKDTSVGNVYIHESTINIEAVDDAIHGCNIVQIDSGTINLTGREGIEGTFVQINGGTINITADDDGINATKRAKEFNETMVQINSGIINIVIENNDADAIDSNGDIVVNGGTINIKAAHAFDFDGTGEHHGGIIVVNDEIIKRITDE